MADDCGSSTPKAPRELRQRLKNGEITEEEFERQRLAIKTSAAKERLSVDTDTPGESPDAPPTPGALVRQFSEMMDPEVGIFALDMHTACSSKCCGITKRQYVPRSADPCLLRRSKTCWRK
jgi:hypothetical protein